MGIHYTPASLAAAQRKRSSLTAIAMKDLPRVMAKEGTNDLRDATTGTITPKQRRQMGYPYARRPRTMRQLQAARRGANLGLRAPGYRQVSRSGAVRVLPTNMVTGTVRRGIFMAKAGRNGWDVGSRSPHAKFLFSPTGTKYMKPREVMGERGKHGKDGLLRVRFRARVQGHLNAIRDYQRKAVP